MINIMLGNHDGVVIDLSFELPPIMISQQGTSFVIGLLLLLQNKNGLCSFEFDLCLSHVDLNLRFQKFLPMLFY